VTDDSTPVRVELFAVQLHPFSHEAHRAPRQRPGDDLAARDLDPRRIASIASMENAEADDHRSTSSMTIP
jgi:hypothetical protein